MLLTTLIPIEFIDNSIPKIIRFLDENQVHGFSDDFINEHFVEEHFKQMIMWILEQSSRTIYYTCDLENNEFGYVSEQENESCSVCGELVTNRLAHDLSNLYTLPSENVEALKQSIKEYQRKKYFYAPTYDNLQDLKEEQKNLVPFIGAGLSVPLGLPNWTQLLKELAPKFPEEHQRLTYLEYTESGDLLKALSYLKEKSTRLNRDDQIKDKIIEIIKASKNNDVLVTEHNIGDILKLKASVYITTNYDHCIEDFSSQQNSYCPPLCLQDIDNMPNLFSATGQVLHIHGHITRKETMIVTEEDYAKLYEEKELMDKLKVILASRTSFFVGFSFNDKFFEDMYEKFHDVFKGHHYMVIANPTIEEVRRYNRDKDIRVVGLNLGKNEDGSTNYNDFIPAFRTLINYIVE
ncbi:hypothetical protein BS614_26125 [Paenibacillus xylanexedens]|uniref:SIR2 family NAD-dependent protein deacylase n=1 Tax=Paenibacillus xylanexedens TaxID=528191 RepID=UPI0009380C29|nr:SIR2 family protein [Paenibacillus xylanexedens]APO47185.1 hypothetical protein BS614_26125 [Paenibacillus xylanexedens]